MLIEVASNLWNQTLQVTVNKTNCWIIDQILLNFASSGVGGEYRRAYLKWKRWGGVMCLGVLHSVTVPPLHHRALSWNRRKWMRLWFRQQWWSNQLLFQMLVVQPRHFKYLPLPLRAFFFHETCLPCTPSFCKKMHWWCQAAICKTPERQNKQQQTATSLFYRLQSNYLQNHHDSA